MKRFSNEKNRGELLKVAVRYLKFLISIHEADKAIEALFHVVLKGRDEP